MTISSIRVWDLFVRLFHWSLVSLFLIAYVTGEEESWVHVYAGYGILGLIVARVIWGFIGGKYARFSNFVRSPDQAIDYLKDLFKGSPKHYLGHNPAGGLMVLALLASLVITTLSGIRVYGLEGYGPLAVTPAIESRLELAQDDDHEDEREHHEDEGEHHEGAAYEAHEEAEEFWEEIHEFFANLTLLLALIHILAVVVSTTVFKEQLIKAMITGRKPRHE